MAQPNRTPAQVRIARFAAIRRGRTVRAEGLGGISRTPRTPRTPRAAANDAMPADLLAACVAAAGFDRNASLGY